MFYTSGTTGRPKGVQRGRQADLAAQAAAFQRGRRGARPRRSRPAPGHRTALSRRSARLRGDGSVQRCADDRDAGVRPGPHALAHRSSARFATPISCRPCSCACFGCPTTRAARFDPSTLATVLHGAAPIAPSVKQQMIEWWGPVLVEYWGASEGGRRHVGRLRRLARRDRARSGGPSPTTRCIAADDDGQRLPAGENGLLWCRNTLIDEVFSYHKDPDKTAQAFRGPGTYTIGDIGRVDDDGYVYLADRVSNMIISGGVNIYPAEVEAVLIEHPVGGRRRGVRHTRRRMGRVGSRRGAAHRIARPIRTRPRRR